MAAILDPATVIALGLGLITATAFVLIAAAAPGLGSRRYRRRLQIVADRKSGASAGRAPVRALTRRESATPAMDRLLKGWLPRRESIAARLGRSGRAISIGQYSLVTVALCALAILGIMFGFGMRVVPSVLLGLAIGLVVPHWVVGRMGRRRVAAFIALFPEAIDLLVRALRSGLPISEAIVNAGHEITDPVGSELRTVEAGMRMGRDLDPLLWDVAKRIDAPEFRFFIIALGVQRETGGNLAETLGNLSDLLRRRAAMRAKARAMAAEARASMMILGSLPILVTLVLLMTSPGYIMSLFTDVRGLMLLGIAVGMLGTGVFIMTRMAKFEV